MKKETNDYSREKKRVCPTCERTKREGDFYESTKTKQCIQCQLKMRETQDQRPPQKVPDKNYWGDSEIFC